MIVSEITGGGFIHKKYFFCEMSRKINQKVKQSCDYIICEIEKAIQNIERLVELENDLIKKIPAGESKKIRAANIRIAQYRAQIKAHEIRIQNMKNLKPAIDLQGMEESDYFTLTAKKIGGFFDRYRLLTIAQILNNYYCGKPANLKYVHKLLKFVNEHDHTVLNENKMPCNLAKNLRVNGMSKEIALIILEAVNDFLAGQGYF